ncbi:SDR family NAD(P)-dependent oxidoreductase [Lentzea tibetensis]|uniref:SDR family NAD(P)-dependent oxidoreductase n=1 Tax=Lentzea tibetensis TaxID=2591470 RepID=A0A563F127_9PSEU|nr:SDR family NAD(P)-dependent oxidoreductase [Lentzea tibetensis]TWP53675.1 SDR family NAD(P)-dependent oxidoreductase [Lentzea tibetensis]
MKSALVTGGSRGLGRALAAELRRRDWRVVVDARHPSDVPEIIVGDVADPAHRAALAAAGPFDLLVNNASVLGPGLSGLLDYPLDELAHVYAVNALAPLALIQLVRPATVVNISSDAAVEAYEGWGGYGSSKAALDQLTAVLAVEHPDLRIYSFDPGDMNTAMHQEAFPGEDISDRPSPETVVPRLIDLIESDRPSGRYS